MPPEAWIVVGMALAVLLQWVAAPLLRTLRDCSAEEAFEASLRADVSAAVEDAAVAVALETACDLVHARAMVSQPFRDRKLV